MCYYTRIPIPWYPYPYTHGTPYLLPTYIHALIHLFIYLFILLSLSLFILLSLSLLLFSSLLFCLLSLSPCLLGKVCPWAEAAGLISLVCTNVLFYLIIIQQYTCIVCMYISLCIVYCVCIHHLLCMYPTDVCMYIVQCVLSCVYAALFIHSSIHVVLCSIDYLYIVCPCVQPVCTTYMLCIVYCLFFSIQTNNKRHCVIIHNAYIKLILFSNIFYLFWRACEMRGRPVASQNSGNTFVVCFSDTSERKSHQVLLRDA